jgi:hypothetical protein
MDTEPAVCACAVEADEGSEFGGGLFCVSVNDMRLVWRFCLLCMVVGVGGVLRPIWVGFDWG